MKKSILAAITITLALLAVHSAQASECRFPYDLSEDEGVIELRSKAIDEKSKLTSLQKHQVIETALAFDEQLDLRSNDDVETAIRMMQEYSEAGDISYIVFEFEGVVYTEVEMYPGGNPFGVIFKGAKAIAQRHDGDIICN
jgi:hypothetical protein